MKESKGPIGSLGHSKNVTIHGAGITGLVYAYYLKQNGYKVRLLEKSDRVGGKIQTTKHKEGLVEKAANAIYTSPEVLELLAELNLPYISSKSGLKRKVFLKSSLINIPKLILLTLPRLLFVFRKTPKDLNNISVYSFFKPFLGHYLSYNLLSAIFSGIYATDSRTLHFKSLFKDLVTNKTYFHFLRSIYRRKKASNFTPKSISFKNGMQDFIDKLQEKLSDCIQLQTQEEINQSENNIITVPAPICANMLQSSYPQFSEILNNINYTSINTKTYFCSTPLAKLNNSFGALFSPQSNYDCMGVLNNSDIFNRTTPEYFSYTMISKEELSLEETHKALDVLGSSNSKLDREYSQHYKIGLPIYDVARYQAISRLRVLALSSPSGLVIAGNYVDGISIREIIQSAKEFSK